MCWLGFLLTLLLGLGLRGVPSDSLYPWWTAATFTLVSLGCATLGWKQRSEQWTFLSGLALQAAVTLIVLFLQEHGLLVAGWAVLLTANTIAASLVALLWLAASSRLTGATTTHSAVASLLTLQVCLVLGGNAALLLDPLGQLIGQPGHLMPLVNQAGEWPGWVSLLLAVAVAWGYARRMPGFAGVHLLGGLGLALGVLLACTAARWDDQNFLAYHVLTVSWALLGGALLTQARRSSADAARVAWVVAVALLVLGLAWRGLVGDPQSPWWSAGAILAVTVLTAGLALIRQRELWALLSGCMGLLGLAVALGQFTTPTTSLIGLDYLHAHLLAAAIVSLLWLLGARQISGESWREPRHTPLLVLVLGVQVVAQGLRLAVAAGLLIAWPDSVPLLVSQVGSILGWVCFFAALVPVGWYAGRTLMRFGLPLGILAGLAVSILVASSVAGMERGQWFAFHMLSVGVALTTLLAFAFALPMARRPRFIDVPPGSPLTTSGPLPHLALGWLIVLLGVVVSLGCRGIPTDALYPWWPAGSFVLVALGCAVLAWKQRSERWAFLSGLLLQAGVTVVVLFLQGRQEFAEGWVPLLQANTITAALVALLWLAASPRLYGKPRPAPAEALLLSLQCLLLLAGNVALLVGPLAGLIQQPERLFPLVEHAGLWPGWASLLLAMVVAWFYAGRVPAFAGVHLLGGLGLALGVQLACTAARWDDQNFLAYHVLLVAWVLLGGVLLTHARRTSGDVRGVAWVLAVGLLVLGLAWRGLPDDPQSPWWSAGAILAISGFAAGLALIRQRELWALAAGGGVLLALAAALGQFTTPTTPLPQVDYLHVHLLAVAGVSLLWLLGAKRLYGEALPSPLQAPLLALVLLLQVLAQGARLGVAADLLITYPGAVPQLVTHIGSILGWACLLAVPIPVWWYAGPILARLGPSLLIPASLAVTVQVASTAARFDQGQWLAFHVLGVGVAMTTLIAFVVALPDGPAPTLH